MESYSILQDLVIWTSTWFQPNPVYDKSTGRWKVTVSRKGNEVTLHPKHIILATGVVDKPRIPTIPGMENFKGKIYHSTYHKNPERWSGKKAVVIGAVRFYVSILTLPDWHDRAFLEMI